jgi:hypothetical protein
VDVVGSVIATYCAWIVGNSKAILLAWLVGLSYKSYKKECQEKNFPFGSMPVHCLGIQPNCLNVHSYSESGLPQAQCRVSSPRAKRRYASSSLWFHFTVVTAPIVSETTSLMVVHWMEWQRMVLLETRGLWLYSIVRGGIGWIRRLACLKHGPDLYDGYFPSKSSVSRTRRPPPGRVPGMERTLSQRRSSCL